MLDNASTVLVGGGVRLVPYRKHHVARYHDWMQDPALLEATASERLTLDEEYAMQKSWREDPLKCTFIITVPTTLAEGLHVPSPSSGKPSVTHHGAMVGDVNLYVQPHDASRGELEVMIAEDSVRRKGIARNAILMMMQYTYENMGIRIFEVRISRKNNASLDLFTNKLGFIQLDVSEFFDEARLERIAHDDPATFLESIGNPIESREEYQPNS